MFKLYGKDEKVHLFKEGDILKFVSEEEQYSPTIKANVLYEVKRTQQIPFTVSLIIPGLDGTIIKLDDLGLYPERPDSVFQLIIGFGGSDDVLFYPLIPESDYFLRLEKSEFAPNPSISQLRYLGELNKVDTPIYDPKLEVITVKDYETVAFQVFNPSSEYKKAIIHFIVNRCKIEEITEKERIEEIEKKKMFIEILDYKLLRW